MDRLLTQYRESPKLNTVIRNALGMVADVALAICDIPNHFDIADANGDQLTLIGKRLGWPRCHCVCTIEPVFGFACGPANSNVDIVGFCESGSWANCREAGTTDLCIDDDEVYRGYLLARRFQALQRYRIDDLQTAMRHIWGNTATATNLGAARVALSPGRALTVREEQELPLAVRVLPIAPGVAVLINRSTGRTFGFGDGWAGFCQGAEWLCPEPFDAYSCA